MKQIDLEPKHVRRVIRDDPRALAIGVAMMLVLGVMFFVSLKPDTPPHIAFFAGALPALIGGWLAALLANRLLN